MGFTSTWFDGSWLNHCSYACFEMKLESLSFAARRHGSAPSQRGPIEDVTQEYREVVNEAVVTSVWWCCSFHLFSYLRLSVSQYVFWHSFHFDSASDALLQSVIQFVVQMLDKCCNCTVYCPLWIFLSVSYISLNLILLSCFLSLLFTNFFPLTSHKCITW